jgi:hypothetical protein
MQLSKEAMKRWLQGTRKARVAQMKMMYDPVLLVDIAASQPIEHDF